MQISTDHIIFLVCTITIVFLFAGCFLLLYVNLYNKRKKAHEDEKTTMLAKFEEALLHSQIEVQEQTMKVIAADIHDNIGQILTLTKLTLNTIDIDDKAKAQDKIRSATDLVGTSIRDLRHLAAILHAETVLIKGLQHAIEQELTWINKSGKYKLQWAVNGEKKEMKSKQCELIAFRLVQEVLNNILKHSEATAIDGQLHYFEHSVLIVFADNGVGFDLTTTLNQPRGLGLQNLYRRSAAIGSELVINSVVDKGTTASLSIPISGVL